MQIQIPVEVDAYLKELKGQIAVLSDRCAQIAGEKASVDSMLNAVVQENDTLKKRVIELEEGAK